MLNTATKLRVHSSWDVETTSAVVALRTLAPSRARDAEGGARAAEDDPGHHPQLAS
jgi:hypothetical protein